MDARRHLGSQPAPARQPEGEEDAVPHRLAVAQP